MLSHLIERRETIIGDATAYARWLANKLGRSKAGVSVDDFTALNHSAVWAATDFIASTLAMLPTQLFRKDEQGNAIRQDVPLARLVSRNPNPNMTPFRWKQVQQAQAILHGNGYAWVEPNARSEAAAIWPLPSRETMPFIQKLPNGSQGLVYRTRLNGEPVTLPSSQVIHISGLSLDGMKGLPFLKYAAEVIGHGLAAQQFSAAFFGQGLTPRFVVTHPGDVGAEGRVRMSEDIDETYGGIEGSHKALVLDEGMKATVLTIAPEQAQMLETRKDNRIEIAGMLRVPPQMIGMWERATFNNAEQMDIFVVKYTIDSWVTRWEQELNQKLLSPRQLADGWFFKMNTNALLRGDIKARANFYNVMMQGVMTGNEIRAKEDLPSIPGLEEPFVPLNMGKPNGQPIVDEETDEDD